MDYKWGYFMSKKEKIMYKTLYQSFPLSDF